MPVTQYIPGLRGPGLRDMFRTGQYWMDAKKKVSGSVLPIKKGHFLLATGDRINKVTTVGTNEVQTLTTTGTPTGGTFTVTFGGVTSAAIAYNATAADIQEILENMSSIGRGNVSCSGGPLPTGVVITFIGMLSARNVAALALGTNGLTGGSTPSINVAGTTAGVLGKISVTTICGIAMEDDEGPLSSWPREFPQAPINLDGPFANSDKEYKFIPITPGMKFVASIEHDVAVTEAMATTEVTIGYNVSRDDFFIASGDTSTPNARITKVVEGQLGVYGGLVEFTILPGSIVQI